MVKLRRGESPEDKIAAEYYLSIQDFVYDILDMYEDQGRYEFAIMLASEMMHIAVKTGEDRGMLFSEVFAEFAEDLNQHQKLQKAINKFDTQIKGNHGNS